MKFTMFMEIEEMFKTKKNQTLKKNMFKMVTTVLTLKYFFLE